MNLFNNKSWLKGAALLVASTFTSVSVFAAGPKLPSEMGNPLAMALVGVMIVLLLAIAILGYVVIGAAQVYVNKLKEVNKTSPASKVLSVIALCLLSTSVFAADEPVQEAVTTIAGLSKSSFYSLLAILGLELIVLIVLALLLETLIAKEKLVVAVVDEKAKAPFLKLQQLWAKMNSFKPSHEEAAITLEHDYDGIRELDNRLPPWWLYSFYVCIIFSFVYLYRFHVSHSAPSSIQEYEMAMAQADLEKEEYLKKAANKVDENTVTLLTDAGALAEGKKIFGSSCAACHGPEGQGTVGPNLTDDYWLHKGGVKDVFKTIKYGVPEKGMKAWKDDFSPVQIANLTSYIKSLKGTKPTNAKEPQGEMYSEEGGATAADSTKLAVK